MLQALNNCWDGISIHSAHGERTASAWARWSHSGLMGCPHRGWHRSLQPYARQPAHVRRQSSSEATCFGKTGPRSKHQSFTAGRTGPNGNLHRDRSWFVWLLRALTGCRSAAAATLVALRNCASCLCRHFLARCEQGTNGASTSWPAMRSGALRPKSPCG